MSAAMARQESHIHAVQGTDENLIGGSSPRAIDRLPFGVVQAVDIIYARTANNPNLRCHGALLAASENVFLPRSK